MNIEETNLADAGELPPAIEGIIDPLDCADELEEMFFNGLPTGTLTGYPSLDQYYRVMQGQWTIITGIPGSGKSTLLDNILVNLAKEHGWKHLICSPEHQPIKRHIASLCSIYTGKEFRRDVMSEAEYAESLAFVQDNFKFIYPPEKDFTVNYILDLAKAIQESGFDFTGFVVDPYNELEHKRPTAMTETEYVSWLLSRFRRYARDSEKHLWLVAHPTKLRKVEKRYGADVTNEEMVKSVYPIPTLYDISGSAHFFNKADMGISVYRDKSDGKNYTQVHVQKVRFRECGGIGTAELRFDWRSGKYSEIY